SFKADCPSDFDCRTVDTCEPAAIAAPAIDYLAKDYQSFRKVILDRLSTISPDWGERDPADVGMVIAEMLAYTGDQLSYYQDAVGTEAYLATARKRLSVRRHARLLDYAMHEGTSARAFVCVEIDPAASGVLLPRYNPDGSPARFLTRTTPEARIAPDPTDLLRRIAAYAPTIFEPMHDAWLYPAHNAIQLYTWDNSACCLPAGATRATLADTETTRLLLMAGDVLVFEEVLGHEPGLGADPRRRQAVRLTKVTPSATRSIDDPSSARFPGPLARDLLTGQPYVEIEWHVDDALVGPICVSSAAQPEPIAIVRGNVILVDHGRTIEEPLGPIDDPLRYRPILRKQEMSHVVPLVEPTSPTASVAATLSQDPHAALPAITLDEAMLDTWYPISDLLEVDGAARNFVVEMDENGYAALRFGDDILGREPVAGLVATYRVGRGPTGNVGAETIVQVMTTATSIIRVSNRLAATGGVDPEAIDDVKNYAPEAFRTQERAVTEEDYATMAMRHPEVRRAVAMRRWTGSWYTVYLTVERKYDRPLDDEFRDEIEAFVEQYRLAGEDLEIEPPSYVPLAITLVACCAPGYFRDAVLQALQRAFAAYFSPDRFAFGEPVYLSQLIAVAMAVPGVDWVDPTDPAFVFRRANDVASDEIARGYIAMDRLEIAQCDNDRSEPEHGQIDFI
ncbi:MAG TPA: putative baseplate assembly protein, partial [Kofleriaceae bacterium]